MRPEMMREKVERLRATLYAAGDNPVTVQDPREMAYALRSVLTAPARGDGAEWVTVPRKAVREMLNAAIDVDTFKLGNISPLGFRCSPQQLFERCWTAMIAAAPAAPAGDGWQPIETAPFTFDTSFDPPTKWLDWCLFARKDGDHWTMWVGGMDADEWLGREDDRSCWPCDPPTHWMPLPAPPAPVEEG